MKRDSPTRGSELMTVGELARRTGLSVKAIREYQALGLIYSAGRSPANYRLFDESALWCAEVIRSLRSLGLTIGQIQALATVYLDPDRSPTGPTLESELEVAERRIDERIAELGRMRQRIKDYRNGHAEAPPGRLEVDLAGPDPRRGGSS